MKAPNLSYGEVRLTQLASDGGQLTAALVGEDDTAWYGYPGDVAYPKADWRLNVLLATYPLARWGGLEQERFERVWNDRGTL